MLMGTPLDLTRSARYFKVSVVCIDWWLIEPLMADPQSSHWRFEGPKYWSRIAPADSRQATFSGAPHE